MRERGSTRVESFEWGTAFFNERFPKSYDHNMVWLERPGGSGEEVAAAIDRVQGAAGLEHREAQAADEADGERLAPAFEAFGWKVHRDVYMALHREPDRSAGAAGEVGWEQFRPARERVYREDPWFAGVSDETIAQLVDRREAVARATRLRHFAARAGSGEIASICDLYSDGRTAQVEDVYTLAAHRGRGLARAVILAAVDVALAEGHDLVFLVADDEDWPKELYGKLGFDAIGRALVFARWPEARR